uniref:Uncharacterized protein AlNc14C52G4033 n=1 Tax=Albugo laibachii Nc14 TaxID=890382 RepID=F0WBI7_9STRA|nr:conserved hypothetical protein [Albugo laibachii Nc14]|eukprot:CCA18514.1 conserved hypothetical protein [Albugo laibachii Nc14]
MAPTMEAFLNALTSGQLAAFSEQLNGQKSDNEASKGTQETYITTLYCQSSVKRVPTRHISFSQLQTAREYACVFDVLEMQICGSENALFDIASDPIRTFTSSTSFHTDFEQMNRSDRVKFILHLLHCFHTNSNTFWFQDMFSTSVYLTEITTILLLLRRNTILQKQPSYQLGSIVSFCCALPIGSEIITQLILNDPAVLERATGTITELIRHPCMTQSVISESHFYRALRAICLGVARLPGPFFAKRILTQLERHLPSPAIGCHKACVMIQIYCEIEALQPELAIFLVKAFEIDSESKFGVHALIDLATRHVVRDDEKCPQLIHDAKTVLQRVQEVLLDQFAARTKPSNSFHRLKLMQAWIYLHTCFCPDPSTIKRLLLTLEDLTNAPANERIISVAYALLLIICSSFAVEMTQPANAEKTGLLATSVRDLIATAQHDIFSLYNTRAACPALILGPILLYTKSPLAISFLCNLVGEERFLSKALSPERLFLVGDHVLKPILSEQTMVRETLGFSDDLMAWHVLHRLLCERSFLRHPHARRLEHWLLRTLENLSEPIHPILYSVLLEYIENYVVAFEYPISKSPLQLAILPFSSSFVSKTLAHPALSIEYDAHSKVWYRAIAILFYVLQFNQRLAQALASSSKVSVDLENAHVGGDIRIAYDLESVWPLRNMWRQVQLHHEDISPILTRLIMDEMPHVSGPNVRILAGNQPIHCDKIPIPRVLRRLKSLNAPISVPMIEFLWRKCLPFAITQPNAKALHLQLAQMYRSRVTELHPAFHFGQIVLSNALMNPQRVLNGPDAIIDAQQYREWVRAPFHLFRDLHPLIMESPHLMELACCLSIDLWRQASHKAQYLRIGMQEGVAHSTEELILIQDSLFFHAIVECIQRIRMRSPGSETNGITRQLLGVLKTLCRESSASQLLPVVHQQGYSPSLIPLLVGNIDAMKSLWEFWMQTNRMSVFVVGTDDQKPAFSLAQLHYRMLVFLALCRRYYTSKWHEMVVSIMRQIINKLHLFVRAIPMAQDDIKTSFPSTECDVEQQMNAHNVSYSMLSALLEAAVGCCIHIDFLGPFLQFLYHMKKEYAPIDNVDAQNANGNVQAQLYALVTRSFRDICQHTS